MFQNVIVIWQEEFTYDDITEKVAEITNIWSLEMNLKEVRYSSKLRRKRQFHRFTYFMQND